MARRPRNAPRTEAGGGPVTVRAAAVAGALSLVVLLGCSGGSGLPPIADFPAIMSEAEGTAEVPFGRETPARAAVRDSFRAMLEVHEDYEAKVGRPFQRQQLRSYFLLDESYIGGSFPRGIAELLREVETLEGEYLAEIRGFPDVLKRNLDAAGVSHEHRASFERAVAAAFAASRQPAVAATEAHRAFVGKAAELYELVASSPESIRSMRDGLEISDPSLLSDFNRLVDEVNAAGDAADAALQTLDARQRESRHAMGLAARAQR